MWTATTFLLGAFVLFLYKLYSKSANFWSKRGVHPLKSDISLMDFLTKKKSFSDIDLAYYKDIGTKKFGGVMEFGTPVLFVKDLDLVKTVMIKDFDNFVDRRPFIDTDPLFSTSLFFLNGKDWKDMRSFLSPTFTSGKIRRMFHHFEASSQKMLDYVSKHHSKVNGGYELIVPDIMGRFTIDVIGATAFGMETDALSNEDSFFFRMAKRASDMSFKKLLKMVFFSSCPKIGNFLKMQIVDSDVSDFFYNILRQGLRNREASTEKRDDLLQLLIEAKRAQLNEAGDSGQKLLLTEELAISQAFLFFMGGFDTNASLLGSSIYVLAAHPDIQERCFAEVERVMDESDGKIPYESINKMEYIDMFISEILRFHTPVSRMERKCMKDYQIPGTEVTIPKGTIVVIPAESIHKDKDIYPEPEEFNPERFSAQNKASRHPSSYLPFGIGPRNCIGMRLGLIEAKMALANVIHNFAIQPIPGKTPIPIKMWKHLGFTRVPDDLEVRFIPRM